MIVQPTKKSDICDVQGWINAFKSVGKALKVMTTFSDCPVLHAWRRDAIIQTLEDLESDASVTDVGSADTLKDCFT
jgi:hypothetical protein